MKVHDADHHHMGQHHMMSPCHGHMEEEEHSHHMAHDHLGMVREFKIRFFVSLIFTIPIFLLSIPIDIINFPKIPFLLFAFTSFIFFYGGYPFLKGLKKEFEDRSFGMMTLVGVAISVSYIYSCLVIFGLSGELFAVELATLIDIMLLGHWIEMKSLLGAGRALEELSSLLPGKAHKVLSDGTEQDIALSELSCGDKVLIKPGEKIPTDGDVLEGSTTVDESLLRGELEPTMKKSGTKVLGGSLNGEGAIVVRVTKTGKESFLAQVIALVQEAQGVKSKTQDVANRAAYFLTLLAIGAASSTFFSWFVIFGHSLSFSFERAVTVMVISCPHALGLAVPLVVAYSSAIAARHGLYIRNRKAFEAARNIQALVFDKTGTLTEGRFGVSDVLSFEEETFPQDKILSFASSLEAYSEHPIGKVIAQALTTRLPVEGFKAIPGYGVEGIISGSKVKIVSYGFLEENSITISNPQCERILQEGKSAAFVLVDDSPKGMIALVDIIRPESKKAIAQLKSFGISCMMLTGDRMPVAKWVKDQVGLDEYFSEVTPQGKAEKIREIQRRGLSVAMTGDGINDAPALACADVGIAVGAGADVAEESADIILARSNPEDIVTVISLSKATYRKMVENLVWATAYNAIAIPLAAGVLYLWGVVLSPAMGAILMSLSTVICALNARLLKY
jgi:P-type Cu2+ transporter